MFPTTDATRGLIDVLARKEYSRTFAEVDAALTNTIVRLFSKLQMTVEQIAEITEIESNAILLVLKKHKLIKK